MNKEEINENYLVNLKVIRKLSLMVILYMEKFIQYEFTETAYIDFLTHLKPVIVDLRKANEMIKNEIIRVEKIKYDKLD